MATTEVSSMPREESVLKVNKNTGRENCVRKVNSMSKKVGNTTDGSQKKHRGGRGNNVSRRKEKTQSKNVLTPSTTTESSINKNQIRPCNDEEGQEQQEQHDVVNKFDISSAIGQVFDGLLVSAVSGTRLGTSLEASLLEKGVTSVVSTIGSPNVDSRTQLPESFQYHMLDIPTTGETDALLRPLHEACDFMDEAMSEGGIVFVHSRAGFSRSDTAILLVLGYMIKYQNNKLRDAIDSLSCIMKHTISPSAKLRPCLVEFEEETLGEISVDDDWVTAQDDDNAISRLQSRRKIDPNERRLLKKKNLHK
mmetsp:Transcript_3427/g.4802  ORF Transcript_3427/g.4802 Transcript_3427/m.4802 type:complete len:308 (-) Transcript_3427:349-1272(-)|eukprot:CAMPEP_0197291162 /NCGR_PEP_ID=MMETSP0890-20130614/11717_1 /TAXON_ID=44058 ORGANISM="Aureoumbra lagunensis, Strain CCMP1510" /NCGR_SAMPLE_ID=MMETSP0890 /ASSEMBLY_ACC=CAM_ASM_000533 /LENGTH=307 /DNA_ID=CAMNT_0042763787 /DNA_START=116 /DNA_END=1039 /DNA_ORIENTATION=-